MNIAEILNLIKENAIRFVDLRFTDTLGKEHHVSVPASVVDDKWLLNGHPFDGSSIAGWKDVQNSDMLLIPDARTARIDSFYEEATLVLICDVIDPLHNAPYDRCSRSIAKRAEAYLKASGIADTAFFGPEIEFFIFDSVSWGNDIASCHVKIASEEAGWGVESKSGDVGHRLALKGGYLAVPPVDTLQDIRSAIAILLEELGVPVEMHHHEVATAGQCEIGTRFSTLVERADWNQIIKYVIRNVAHQYGKTATFMPKPIFGDNGSGMHVHQSLWKGGKNLFAGDNYANLSELALYYIGGIIKHAKALNAITNSTTNSYKRLVPGYEAPVILAYSAHNRSSAIRIPYGKSEKERRIEVRFPDPLSNPYLAFSALLMAGLDGIKNKIHPGESIDQNLYKIPLKQSLASSKVCHSLDMALIHLDNGRAFLTQGGVFSDEWIDGYIALKSEEVKKFLSSPHPVEFGLYYSL